MSTKHGVNFGGWLVLEKWMTPSLFAGTDAVDEYTFMQAPGAKKVLAKHRKEFITEKDFAWLSKKKVQLIRLPVGYWALEDDAPYMNARKELDWAMRMAKKYQIDMIIDVHGLPGSQNGYDHSGRKGAAEWFRSQEHREKSVVVVAAIARRYADNPRFWGIQVINEPLAGMFNLKLKAYYRKVGRALEQILRPHTRIIFSDAYRPRLLSGAMKNIVHPVIMDVHLYHMTTWWAQRRSLAWFFKKTRRRVRLLRRLSKKQPLLIGEWSGTLDGVVLQTVPEEGREELGREYIALQQAVFDQAVEATTYWNYKTESSDAWNFRVSVQEGRISLD